MQKQCKQCNEVKLLEVFPKNNKGNTLGKCKVCVNNNAKVWRSNNPLTNDERKKQSESVLKNRAKNKQKYREYQKTYQKNRYATDVEFLLKKRLRNRLYLAVTKNKSYSAVKDLGCSIVDLKKYLESKWQPGMTWDNYGEWQIDHIVPLKNFNLVDREQFLAACNFKNLQPLWIEDHLVKTVGELTCR